MGENDKLFGKPQILLLRPDGTTEWAEVHPVRDSITLGKMEVVDGPQITRLTVSFKLNTLSRKARVKIGQLLGHLKRPRCTYKTVKRGCAKRNRR